MEIFFLLILNTFLCENATSAQHLGKKHISGVDVFLKHKNQKDLESFKKK